MIKRIILTFILIILTTPYAIGQPSESGNLNDEPAVLVLHSYYPTYEWSNRMSEGIIDEFGSSEYSNTDIYFEYMDAKRHSDQEYLDHLANLYRYRYTDNDEFDLIICADNHAIEFICSDAGKEIFSPEIPVVFCGANSFDPEWIRNRPLMTGVVESIEIEDTMDIILDLHPDVKNIYVVNDHHTLSSLLVNESASQIFEGYEDRVDFEYSEDLNASQLQEEVAGLSEDTVIFLLLFNRDRDGKEITMVESAELISEVSKVPIYSTWEFYLEKGIVGGKMLDSENEGRAAVQLALRVLDGENVSQIPIISSTTHEYMFDGQQLEKFSISTEELPEGSIVVNNDIPFHTLYRNEILITFSVVLIQALLIAGLIANKVQLHKTQKKLKKAKLQAEESDRLKSNFLANMSHEIRTPMNAIIGFSGMLKIENVKPEKRDHYVDMINQSGKHLLSLINDILDISRIESGKMEVYKKDMSVNKVMDEMQAMFTAQLQTKNNIELIIKKGLEDEQSIIYSDRGKVSQILNNLINNAIKFTEKGTIEAGYVLKEDLLEFHIKDTGIGIPDDKKDAVFARFQQVEGEYSRSYEGAGLGLTISRSLAQMLGGDMWFTSNEGEGSCFYFTIPHEQGKKE